jgi:oligopeptide transport system ATP-binding protein
MTVIETATPAIREARAPVPAAKPLLEVRGLQMYFPISEGVVMRRQIGDVKAVDGVDLTIGRGETLGLVGESGCGKTTMGRCILRLEKPTAGEILYDGIDIAKLGRRQLVALRRKIQVIFQDPYSSLNPRQKVGSILAEPMMVHGVEPDRARRIERVRELLSLCGLNPNFADRYPHEMSGGQRQRVGIARALALNPEFIVCDEAVSALDVSIQAQIINLLEELQRDFGLTYLFVAHDLAVVRHISDRIIVMYLGKIVEIAPADDLYDNPLHPYTITLLSAIPIPDPEVERNRRAVLVEGDLPSPANPPSACRFHTRCPFVQPTRCADEEPLLREVSGHQVACHYAEEVKAGRIPPRAGSHESTGSTDEPHGL